MIKVFSRYTIPEIKIIEEMANVDLNINLTIKTYIQSRAL